MKNTFDSIVAELAAKLLKVRFPLFQYYRQDNMQLCYQLSYFIIRFLFDIGQIELLDQHLIVIEKIVNTQYHFYLIGDYLNGLKNGKAFQALEETKVDSLAMSLSTSHEVESKKTEFSNTLSSSQAATIEKQYLEVRSLSDFFSSDLGKIYYSRSKNDKEVFEHLWLQSKGKVGEYIESLYDMPGMNSLVRRGLVKIITMDQAYYVSKRENPEKPGRFQKEQENIDQLINRLSLPNMQSQKNLGYLEELHATIMLQVVRPNIIYKAENGHSYSIAELQCGLTLEEILKTCKIEDRCHYLSACRLVLDYLYEQGIIWTDMAPRNIILDMSCSGVINFCILDFEKTIVLPFSPASEFERIEHCRGPICIEEFGTLCARDEVESAFYPYFNPSHWDISSNERIPYEKPKRELLALFHSQGINDITFGQYNSMERDVAKVRFPFMHKG